MTPVALLLVLAAAICHATWNLIAKKTGGGNAFMLLSALFISTLWLPVVVWVGVQEVGHWGWAEWAVTLFSALLHVVYFRALLHGYQVSDLTVVYPVARGSGPLLSSVGAVILLGDHLSLIGAVGALAVVGGVFLIAGGPQLTRQAHDPAQRDKLRLGLIWGMVTGAFIASYSVLDGYAVKIMLISPILLDYFGNLLRMPLILPFVLRDRAAFWQTCRTQWRPALVIAFLSPISYVMVLYAVRLAPLSHVAPAREVSMLFAAIAGGTLLGEGDRWWRLAGAMAIAAGVAGLALG